MGRSVAKKVCENVGEFYIAQSVVTLYSSYGGCHTVLEIKTSTCDRGVKGIRIMIVGHKMKTALLKCSYFMYYKVLVLSLFLRNRGLWRPASVFSM